MTPTDKLAGKIEEIVFKKLLPNADDPIYRPLKVVYGVEKKRSKSIAYAIAKFIIEKKPKEANTELDLTMNIRLAEGNFDFGMGYNSALQSWLDNMIGGKNG